MRTAIVVARRHGETGFEMLCGPEIPITDQQSKMREWLSAEGVHEDYAEIQLWESDQGIWRSLRFKNAEQSAAHAAQIQRDTEKFESARKPKKQK